MSDKIIHLTDDSFDTDVLKADGLTLVDFWAEWCGPCKMIAPILDEIAEEYQGKLTVAKLNIDQNPGTAPKYGIRGIPTLLLFKNGEVAATKVGALSKGQLKEFLDANGVSKLLFRRPDSYFLRNSGRPAGVVLS